MIWPMRLNPQGLSIKGPSILKARSSIWCSDTTGDITWELEDKMPEQYPNLFLGKWIFLVIRENCNIVFLIIKWISDLIKKYKRN